MKYGGKTNPIYAHYALNTPPIRIVEPGVRLERRGKGGRRGVEETGRTTAKGDQTGWRRPQQRDVHLTKRKDTSLNTVEPSGTIDPETGRVHGVKIGPCQGCGKVRRLTTVTSLCGVRACLSRRQRQYQKRTLRRRAADWLDQQMEAS